MKHSPAVARLIDALRTLPGVGPKTAQRMAVHLLQDGREGARRLAEGLENALANVTRCRQCRMFTESELCAICAAPQRDASLLCVVESPADVVAVEQSGGYRGRYFVLMGHLSPLDGIGPEQLGVGLLETLLEGGAV
ncbi:MAG: recombination mediator RecR, partial [Gammaproteobacteria bacterium]